MFQISNFTGNDDVRVLDSKGPFMTIEYIRDLSVVPNNAVMAYFCNEMNIRKRQVICDLSKSNVTVQAGAMQWMAGNVQATTGIKGVGDFFGKAIAWKSNWRSCNQTGIYRRWNSCFRTYLQAFNFIGCSRME